MSAPSGQFQIESVLGKGGFGTVYRALFRGEGGFAKRVAIKVLNASKEDFEDYARRLRDEARMMGLLTHRAIVRADRLVLIEGRWAVVMELIEGVDLAAALKVAPLPVGPAVEILAELAGALHAAQETPGADGRPLNLQHRDLKPSNVMLTRYGEVKVLDFGGARADFESREACTRQFSYGTQEYMAPERLDFRESATSDVYSMGAILYELVAGVRFGRTSLLPDRHAAHVAEAVVGFEAAMPVHAPALVRLLQGMLAYEPAARPTSGAVELACLDIARVLPGPRLRTFADQAVPVLLAQRPAAPVDALTGSLVHAQGAAAEGDSAPSLSPPLPPPAAEVPPLPPAPVGEPAFGHSAPMEVPHAPEPEAAPEVPPRPARRWVPVLVVGIAVALAALVGWKLVSLGAAMRQGGRPHGEDPEITDLQDVLGHSVGDAEQEPGAPEPEAATSRPAGRQAAEAPVPVDEPSPHAPPESKKSTAQEPAPAPSPSPVALPPQLCDVQVTGDADSVRLVRDSRWYQIPGAVPPGTYEIWVAGQGYEPEKAGRVSIALGDAVTIQCVSRYRRCVVKK
ncbi:MAG: protein kinase [Pseudomonadota bacterium]